MHMSERRITELEEKMAYQEDAIQELNRAILVMQKQIDGLEVCCQTLKDRVREVSSLMPGYDTGDEKPPHYWLTVLLLDSATQNIITMFF